MRSAIILATALLAGCTTAKTMMVDDRTALVSADDLGWGGNLTWKVITAAAQMAQQRGFERFEIVSSEDQTRTGVVAMPGSATTTGSAYCYGSWCSGSATTTGRPGYLMPYTRNRRDVVVRFYHEADAPPNAYVTAAVLAGQK